MRTTLGIAAGFLIAAAAVSPALAATNSEFAVGANGTFTAKNLVVMQKAGSALYCRAVWGEAFIRLTVLTSTTGSTTQFVRAHGGAATVDDVAVGDLLDVVGTLQTGADSLLINAAKVNDHSLNVESKGASGIIQSMGQGSFTMIDKKLGVITVTVGTSTITKGVRTISAAELAKGDKVLSVGGGYDYSTNTLSATGGIAVWQDPSMFKAKTYVGTLKQLPGSTLPTSFLLSTNGADYQVFLSADTKVINKAYGATQLSRFAAGDTVRVYGAIRQENLANMDATIVRDLNF